MATKEVMSLIFILIFVVLGIIFSVEKASFLIAGYNTMSEKEKEEYDIQSLSKFMGKIMFVIAFSIFLLALSDIYRIKILYNIGVGLNWIVPIFAVLYINISKGFKN